MKKEILTLLRADNGYVSGQEICNRLGVSRTAVWKAINQLKEEGYQISAVSNKGYHLTKAEDVIYEHELASKRSSLKDSNSFLFNQYMYFEEIDSTNTKAKELANQGKQEGLAVVANHQVAGRGRRGRVWEATSGEGIYLSLLLRPKFAPTQASMLTLVAALCVVDAIKEVTGLTVGIKWPNDIICSNKKVCGILTEMSSEQDFIHYVVVGIGINTNNRSFSKEVEKIATSLMLESGVLVNRSDLIVSVLNHFERYYTEFLKTEDMSELLTLYNSRLVHREQMVRIVNGSNISEGRAIGIDKEGQLVIECENKEIKTIISGEISVRGLNGYV